MSAEPLPPVSATPHVLRPHHIALVALTIIIFRPASSTPSTSKIWNVEAHLHALRLLLDEVAELTSPRHFTDLLADLRSQTASSTDNQIMAHGLERYAEKLRAPGSMNALFDEMLSLVVVENDELATAPIDRRSLLGVFCRRCHLSFAKLSFFAILRLQDAFSQWRQDRNSIAGYIDEPSELETISRNMLYPTSGDYQEKTQTDWFQRYQAALDTGDHATALEFLHKFFDQHIADSTSQHGLLQYALLSAARLHFILQQLPEARRMLEEAISVARTNGDKVILEHCMSLSRRLSRAAEPQGEITGSPHSSTSALDALFDIRAMITNKQPVSLCWEKLYQAVGSYDLSSTYHHQEHQPPQAQPPDQPREKEKLPAIQLSSPAEQFAQHAIQAQLWTYAGCSVLAEIQENIVLTFSESGSGDELRFNMKLLQARRAGRQGRIDEGLSILLDCDTWQGISNALYQQLTCEIGNLLQIRRLRRGISTDSDPPIVNGFIKDIEGKENDDSEQLRMSFSINESQPPSRSLQILLGYVWDTEYSGHFLSHRLGMIALADLGLELRTEKKSLEWLDEILPQVTNGDDLEARAYAYFTMARALVATGKGSEASLRQAASHLMQAEKDYVTLEIPDAVAQAQGLLSIVYHRLGMIEERDRAAGRHNETMAAAKEMRKSVGDDMDIKSVWEVVEMIGSVISNRHQERI